MRPGGVRSDLKKQEVAVDPPGIQRESWGGEESKDGEVLGSSREETSVGGKMQAAPGAEDITQGTQVSAQLVIDTKCCETNSLPKSAAFISKSVFSNCWALLGRSCRQGVGFVLGSKMERQWPSRVISSRSKRKHAMSLQA